MNFISILGAVPTYYDILVHVFKSLLVLMILPVMTSMTGVQCCGCGREGLNLKLILHWNKATCSAHTMMQPDGAPELETETRGRLWI